MDKADFDSIMRGMRQVASYEAGEREGFVTHAQVPDRIDVKAIRSANNMTQEVFAKTFGFAVSSLKDWEQGRRQPDRSARILLQIIAKEPEAVHRALHAA